MFNGHLPRGYQLKSPEGITWPAGNTTEEIQTSICAITDYLGNHMPAIIRNLMKEHHETLIRNINAFNTQFKAVASIGQNNNGILKPCHRNVTTSHDYTMKKTGLKILYFSKQWVQHFANGTCVFNY